MCKILLANLSTSDHNRKGVDKQGMDRMTLPISLSAAATFAEEVRMVAFASLKSSVKAVFDSMNFCVSLVGHDT